MSESNSRDDLPENRDEAVASLLEVAENAPRSIVIRDYAEAVCEALDLPLPDDTDFQPTNEFAAMVDPDDETEAIGFCYLLIHVVDELGGEPITSSPFMGRGRNAEFLTEKNAAILQQMELPWTDEE